VRRSLALLLAVSGLVLALDQWSKHWATRTLMDRAPVPVLGDLVRFTYTRNSGVAFGLGAGSHFPFYIFSLIAAAAILALFLRGRVRGPANQVALALIFGGALGNLLDRLRTGLVVDFIELSAGRWHFPVFNVADSAVTVGVVLFALGMGHAPEPSAAGPARPGAEAPGGEAADAGIHGPGAARGGAAGPLPGGGPGRPLA
jgi:signal peptidase II